MVQLWTNLYDDLQYELRQVEEEGRIVTEALKQKIADAIKETDHDVKTQMADEIAQMISSLPYENSNNAEPDEWDAIQALVDANSAAPVSEDIVYERCLGGWLGRAAGCLLGKPIECWRTPEIHLYLNAVKNVPVSRYITSDGPDEVKDAIKLHGKTAWDPFGQFSTFIDKVDCMPEDDDTNYTILGLKLLETCGRQFTSENVGDCWLGSLPYYHLCTAERVAYRNLILKKTIPQTASYCNPYREWIGAQIRADIFGYVNPGDPHTAAEMAWRDGRVSHVKNGIYGEMLIAAMIAQAYVDDDPVSIIRTGLREIPYTSRIHAAVMDVLNMYENGKSWEETMETVTQRWDEYDGVDWCHVISNAQIVATSLLYSHGDFTESIGKSVWYGFDTDCNAATVGSIVGVMKGAKAIPESWTRPLNDKILSGVHGFAEIKISEAARRTVALIKA